MSKSSTVTVRERPVEDVASAKTGGLTIHGETFIVETDQRIELVDLTNRVMELVSRFNVRGAGQPLVDAHHLRALHQRVSNGAAVGYPPLPRTDGGARRRVDAQQPATLGLRPDERRLASASAAARSQPHAAGQRWRGRARTVAAHFDGGARRSACAVAAHPDLWSFLKAAG